MERALARILCRQAGIDLLASGSAQTEGRSHYDCIDGKSGVSKESRAINAGAAPTIGDSLSRVIRAREPDKFVEAEMLSKFHSLAGGISPGEQGEARLRGAIKAALDQLDE